MDLLVSQLQSSMNSPEDIQQMCRNYAPNLTMGFISNKPAFLYALSGIETTFGKFNRPRHEPNYAPGGIYYQNSKELKSLYQDYGAYVSCSYGPWQMMAATCMIQLGYKGHPAALQDANVCIPYVIIYLNWLWKQGADSIDKLAACWNAGPGVLKDPSRFPKNYVSTLDQIYDNQCKLLK